MNAISTGDVAPPIACSKLSSFCNGSPLTPIHVCPKVAGPTLIALWAAATRSGTPSRVARSFTPSSRLVPTDWCAKKMRWWEICCNCAWSNASAECAFIAPLAATSPSVATRTVGTCLRVMRDSEQTDCSQILTQSHQRARRLAPIFEVFCQKFASVTHAKHARPLLQGFLVRRDGAPALRCGGAGLLLG